MTEEQIQQFRNLISDWKAKLEDFETMLDDFTACKSETSKKYLGAVITRTAETFKQS